MKAHSASATGDAAGGQLDQYQEPKPDEDWTADWIADSFGQSASHDGRHGGSETGVHGALSSAGSGKRTTEPNLQTKRVLPGRQSRATDERPVGPAADADAGTDGEIQTGADAATEDQNDAVTEAETGPGRSADSRSKPAPDDDSEAEQWSLFGPGDQGFMDEFGGTDDADSAQQEIFDWFALEIDDPLDVQNDVFGEAEALPGLLADMEKLKLSSENSVDAKPSRNTEFDFEQSITAPSEANPDPNAGSQPSQRKPEEQHAKFQEDPGPIENDAAAEEDSWPEAPQPTGPRNGQPTGNRRWLPTDQQWPWRLGRNVRRISVICLAAILGIAAVHSAGVGGFGDRFLQPIAEILVPVGEPFRSAGDAVEAIRPAADPGNPLDLADHTESVLAVEPGHSGPTLVPTGRNSSAMPQPAREPFRLILEPVGLEAGVPVKIDAADAAEWNRLLELLHQTAGLADRQGSALEENTEESIVALQNSSTEGSDGISSDDSGVPIVSGNAGFASVSGEITRTFTADDGFAPSASIARPDEFAVETDIRKARPGNAADPGGQAAELEILHDSGHSEHGVATTPSGQPPETIAAVDASQRLEQIEKRLTVIEQELNRLDGRSVDARSPEAAHPLHLSFGEITALPVKERDAAPTVSQRAYVMKGGSGNLPLSAELDNIKIGDQVGGFGRVIDLSEYEGGGRLLVMENGTVFVR